MTIFERKLVWMLLRFIGTPTLLDGMLIMTGKSYDVKISHRKSDGMIVADISSGSKSCICLYSSIKTFIGLSGQSHGAQRRNHFQAL